jgi:hypothetical protein
MSARNFALPTREWNSPTNDLGIPVGTIARQQAGARWPCREGKWLAVDSSCSPVTMMRSAKSYRQAAPAPSPPTRYRARCPLGDEALVLVSRCYLGFGKITLKHKIFSDDLCVDSVLSLPLGSMETSFLSPTWLNSFPFASSTHLSVDSRGAPPCAGLIVGASAQKTEFV